MFDYVIFASLISIQLIIFLFGPANASDVLFNACTIQDWTSECIPSQKRALEWCNVDNDRLSALMLNMKKNHPKDMRVVPATCFGTNVQLLYLTIKDEFLINPVIVERSSESAWSECRGIQIQCPLELTVAYINANFVNTKRRFHNVDAFALNCEILQQHVRYV